MPFTGKKHRSLQDSLFNRNHFLQAIVLCTGFVATSLDMVAQKTAIEKPLPPIYFSKGKLQYTPDSLGNRIPDFSWCGYRAGEQPVPDAPVRVAVSPNSGDATARIQAAIDYVSKLPVASDQLRGTVLLQKGTYNVKGSLNLHTSGVVLRGSGFDDDGTVVIGAGSSRETLVKIAGNNDRVASTAVSITDEYVPVNARSFGVANATGFKTGDKVIITMPSTREWIEVLGTDHFGGGITSLGWKPNQRQLEWVRTITAIDGNKVTIDAPITNALDKKYGGGNLALLKWPGLISDCGIENIQLRSVYDTTNEKDEDHRWMAIIIDNTKDSWVRQVSFKHFAGSAVAVYENASRITVEDCISKQPISETGGERRNTFFTAGQQILFQRCYAEYGIHDFATGFCAPGPNAFVQCESFLPYGFSGGVDSWSPGVLFDLVTIDGNAISFLNRGQDGNGAGWNNANSVAWNCSAARIDCYQPPTAQNWAFGSWSQFAGNGYWGESNNSIEPRSLYYAQLKERIGTEVDKRTQVMNIETNASSSPSVETAANLTKLASNPATSLLQFIRESSTRQPVNVKHTGIKTIDDIGIPKEKEIRTDAKIIVENGWLVRERAVLTGARSSVPWWSGSARPYAARNAGMAITRFVPGKTGRGLTDDLGQLTDSMRAKNITAIEQNYGLWYDRRRDDHQRVRRMDGDVWAPFYELPFARTGKGQAWDGLSKYDLTKYNQWYWHRLKTFADLADSKGLVLIHQNYFQHNILEAGAHYADFPWRSANNINNTGFPEPVPYAGDKRIFMAAEFYDTLHPVRRELHKKYIRQCLGNFAGNNSVIQLTGEEFTGPLHFVQFWLNTINEWQRETANNQLIGLSATKDVQDAILNDSRHASVIDIIDIRYWHYQGDGNLYAPQGGQNLAPRQHARLLKPKSSSPQQVYRSVLEYRLRYPGKAVIYSADAYDRNGWAVLMAGGSLPNLKVNDIEFLKAVSKMSPVVKDTTRQWILFNETSGYVIYDLKKDVITADITEGSYEVIWIDTISGESQKTRRLIRGQKKIALDRPAGGNWVLWLKKRK